MHRASRRRLASLLGLLLLTLIAGPVRPQPAPASGTAATVSRTGSALVVAAAVGVANDLRIEQLSAAVRISDAFPIEPMDPTCAKLPPSGGRHFSMCEVGDVTRLDVRLSDMSDVADASGLILPVTFVGGSGDDRMIGGTADDRFVADASNDGADLMDGGPGSDTVDYGLRTSGVDVSLDNLGNDGARTGRGEGDNVRLTVENAVGSDAADVLTPSSDPAFAAAQTLIGGGGDDRITGGPGDDTILGGPGRDKLDGGAGSDWIDAGPGDDGPVDGERGDDVMTGGEGDDHVRGGHGTDVVRGGPGNDHVRGGPDPGDFCDGERGVDVEDRSDCETG